ncbi:AraC family transcriptional regulator [Desulfosarcina ovata subsp. sediminis]|uniref:AraC family transcriptional regulator n=1 Tax=Desulfosarcina ovata subsp. sediminis TaxID=885957 RepID=A0A5K7ZYS8_9BACT|nr:AraC family transcriptional regulator [Desulfosarcina ovata]BBO85433.1 AraC family transcriptional regulator [Desulfosarcina ovata subsp. sediminis]
MATQDHICYSPRAGFYSPTARVDIKRYNPERFEYCWQGSGDFGNLRFARTEIRPGFDIWTTVCRFHEDIRFSMADGPAAFCFNFCLSGKSSARYGTSRELIEMSSGNQGIFYCPDPNGTGCMHMDVPHRQVGIVISPERLRSYFESDLNAIHPKLRRILEEKQNDLFCRFHTITPAMHAALEQLLDCPFSGMTRKLFFESRALELIAHQLRHLFGNPPKRVSSGFRLHSVDRKRAESARDLLVSRLENPPGLGQLAREAGMSHPKLNRCFREMYGMTVFQYLRNERLNRARQMLDDGLNVTETAYAVGYDSISHFSQAFKKQFGASPSRCMGIK